MTLLVIDGNSILNRAFYGIKLLTTKDGRFTNAIYGFINVLLRLSSEYSPDAVAIAFDVKAPTFRHKMYSEYKAGRKGMPPELAGQLPVLKELLTALGYKIVESPGWEADDILGTLAAACEKENKCLLATGDRDSLQLIRDNVSVLLISTKMGQPQTVEYDRQRVLEEYLVEPEKLIDIKALMGDSSDNIPGVAGIGQKTASSLVSSFGTIDDIYEKIDESDIKDSVKNKLIQGKESAFLSRTLGTVCLDVPIDKNIQSYVPAEPNSLEVTKIMTGLEMFKLLEKLNLNVSAVQAAETNEEAVTLADEADFCSLFSRLKSDGRAVFFEDEAFVYFSLKNNVVRCSREAEGFEDFFGRLIECGEVKKYTSDIKKLFALAKRNRLHASGFAGDIALCGYVLNPSSSAYDIERLSQEYGVSVKTDFEDKTAQNAALLSPLFERLNSAIKENGQEGLLNEIEVPLAGVLAEMELEGFEVDRFGIEEFGDVLGGRIKELEVSIFSETGYEFNLNSPKQLGEALFVKLGLPTKKKTKTGYSTNAEVLESLANDHPVVESILSYRTLAKLKSTYCDGLVKVVGLDGRIHSTLNQTETRTGRISSTEPNLQNIPVRSELGRELRKYFRAKQGCVLVDADYSQIELRVLAHLANDKVMIDAFNNDLDIHSITASQVFGMPPEMVTPLMRTRAKAVNFGIVYGIGAFSLSKDIGVSVAEADKYIKGYLQHYSGVELYMKNVVEEAKENGFVTTLFGRRRYLPELASSNANMRNFGERVARNMPIQGTAADIIKIAMIKVSERLERENLGARLILQVHDELIVEAPKAEAARVETLLKEEMENAAALAVKLTADVNSGKTWFDAKG